jgi:TRAP-type C4-dicarboxylate transport system substrate-binding protein
MPLACAQPAPAPAPAPAPEPMTIKAVTSTRSDDDRTIIFQKWVNLFVERSKGELAVEYLGGPEVIPPGELPLALKNGTVDLSVMWGSTLKGLVPETRLLALSRLTAMEEIEGGSMDYLRERFALAGQYLVGKIDPSMQKNFILFLRTRIETPEDLAGVRFVADGTFCQEMAKAWKTDFSMLKEEDIYSALDRGMADIYSSNIISGKSMSLFEVTDYILDHPFYVSNSVIAFNLDTWNKFSPNLQEMIQDTYIESIPQFAAFSLEGFKDARIPFEDAGVEFIKFSPEDEKRFMDVTYEAEAKIRITEMPDTAPQYLKMVGAIK